MVSRSFNTNNGKVVNLKRMWLTSPDVTAPSQFIVRSGGDLPDVTSSTLGTLIPINDGIIIDNCDDTTGWTATNGDVSSNSVVKVKGTAAINLTKTSSTDLTCSSLKTVSSFNLTDKKVFIFIYTSQQLLDILTDVKIRLEDDSSNYVQKTIPPSEFNVGWNFVQITEDDNVVGTPDLTTLTEVRLILEVNAVTDVTEDGWFIYDDIKLVGDADFKKNFVGSYPQVNDALREVTIRGTLNSVQANGFNIDGWGMINTDDPYIIVAMDTFPSESKSQSDEFTFIRKNRRL